MVNDGWLYILQWMAEMLENYIALKRGGQGGVKGGWALQPLEQLKKCHWEHPKDLEFHHCFLEVNKRTLDS